MNRYARNTDPHTSHEAAETTQDLRRIEKLILEVVGHLAFTDEDLIILWDQAAALNLVPWHSPSGLRTRRKSLSDLELLEVVGLSTTRSNRSCRVWKAVK
jgi:hypothetical protein